MAVLDSDTVDVWIMGFDLAPEDAAEGIAWAFEMDLARAAALVASVPRLVRRGVTVAEAGEAAEALARAGADVELCPEGVLPARLEAVSEATASSGSSARGPRVRVKQVVTAGPDASAALLGDEPAYGEGSSAYVPIRPLPARGPARRAVPAPVGVAPPVPVQAEAPADDAFDADLELGSLIPAPMRAPAPASLRPPGMPSSAPPAEDDLEALQTALASLPKVKAPPRASPPTRAAERAAAAPPVAASPVASSLQPTPESAAGRNKWVAALGGLVLVGVLLALGRSMFGGSPSDDVAAAATEDPENPENGLTDAQLLASTADYVSEDARTWLRLDELNHFGDMSPSESRAFLERLGSAGALSSNVGLPADAPVRGGVLLLQHSPLHRAALIEAATAHPTGRVVPAPCVEVGRRYMLIRFDGCD
jgi:hypothetical protein